MTDLLPSEIRERVTLHLDDEPSLRELAAIVSSNARITQDAYTDVQTQLAALKRKPPRERRTGAAARMNPDSIVIARIVMWGVFCFALAGFVASFGGQYAMAPYTQLPQPLWGFVPFAIEAPVLLLTLVVAVLRRRKQSVRMPWFMMIALTALSSAVNVLHIVIESGMLELGDYVGAVVMGLIPWIVLYLFKEFVRLAVKPTGEAPDPTAAPAPVRKPTTRKATRK